MRPNQKHTAQLPSPRSIRRACSRELYRALKRLDVYVPQEKIEEAETIYYKKVVGNLLWIFEHRSNKKKQAEWWAEAVAPEIAPLWGVNEDALVRAFKDGFAGA
ncbi:dehydrogenase [Paenibacillus sp.]|uniref:dehydrogenase n=1 Tax=Paenibacillus sp. TaxID=58172 RepID=UPI002D2BFEC7|nr:dehydrogenase [Paenibacillus sp.]HZG86502.1 dehydrogenase [Paenibacillus sp.]